MFQRSGPDVLVRDALCGVTAQITGLRDGREEAIHDARVAIRRLREAAALARPSYDNDVFDGVDQRLAEMFKVLGRARDADTEQALVQYVESRFPLAPATLGQLRAAVAHSRLRARRKVVKALEALDLPTIPQELHGAYRARRRGVLRRDRWSDSLRAHIVQRATEMLTAIDHAGGVYFRKRSHSARLSIKRLRYALELAADAEVWGSRRAIRTLRKAQEWLGQAHDREVLLRRLRSLPNEGAAVNSFEVQAIERFLQGEIGAFHERYVTARPDLAQICFDCRALGHPTSRVAQIAVVAVAVPALLMWRHQ